MCAGDFNVFCRSEREWSRPRVAGPDEIEHVDLIPRSQCPAGTGNQEIVNGWTVRCGEQTIPEILSNAASTPGLRGAARG
jgi:hypothetical protein